MVELGADGYGDRQFVSLADDLKLGGGSHAKNVLKAVEHTIRAILHQAQVHLGV